VSKRNRYPKSLTAFQNALISEVARLTDKDQARLSQRMLATLKGTPESISPPPQTAYEHFVIDIFRAYGEVFQSFDNLARMVDLIRLRFKKSGDVTRLQYLSFVLEASLNEFYIFSERMQVLLVTLQRKYRSDAQFQSLQSSIPAASEVVRKTLEPIVQIRGSHVHERRYSGDDEKIKRAGALEMLVVHGKMTQLRPIYRKALSDAQKHAVVTIKTLERSAKVVSDAVFKHLSSHLIDSDKAWRYPKNIKRSG
jgi:hypothetical protein